MVYLALWLSWLTRHLLSIAVDSMSRQYFILFICLFLVSISICWETGPLEPQYRIRFVNELSSESETLSKIEMTDPRDGIKYSCVLPSLSIEKQPGMHNFNNSCAFCHSLNSVLNS